MDMTLDELKAYINTNDRFAKFNGMQLTVLREGYAEAEMTPGENSLNGVDIVQGGAIFTLADLALAGASNSYGIHAVTQNATIHFVRPGNGARLRATARELNRGRRTGLFEIEVVNDAGKLVARISSAVFFLDGRFESKK